MILLKASWYFISFKAPSGSSPISTPVHNLGGLLLSTTENKEEEDDDDEDISVVVDPVVAYTPPQDEFGYGLLEEELDEEALLAGEDVDDEDVADGTVLSSDISALQN